MNFSSLKIIQNYITGFGISNNVSSPDTNIDINSATGAGAGLIYIHETTVNDDAPDPLADCRTTKDSSGNNQENAGRMQVFTDLNSHIVWRPNGLISTFAVIIYTVGWGDYLRVIGV